MSITLEHLSYVYNPGTAYEKHALKDVSLEIPQGQFVGIIGHTGSGKSTLIQHLNGLMKATSGRLLYEGKNIYEEGYDMKQLRTQVGLVFQYPEYQLFEVDVLSDVCFGPKNQGLSKEECEKRAKEALELVGFPEELYLQSPFELSGGQKRRAAIAGVLAMRPKVLVLDEPTAGLDPKERIRIRNLISDLSEDRIVLIATHVVSDIEFISKEILLMKNGRLVDQDSPENLQKRIYGHVYELCISQDELAEVKKEYEISNLFRRDGEIIVRVIADKCPVKYDAVKVSPTLEDVYLYEFEGVKRW